jgi:hypothetical protein
MKAIALILMSFVGGSPAYAGEQRFASPDRRIEVRVVGIGKPGFMDQESRVEVRTRSGRGLAVRSFGSADGEHGFGLRRGGWTPDGRWFVFNLDSSGGHQPWHVLTYAYDTRSRHFYNLDDYIGPVMSDFALSGKDAVAVTRMNVDTGAQDEPVTVHLARIARRVPAAAQPN